MKRTRVKDFWEELEFSCVLMIISFPFLESLSRLVAVLLLGAGLAGLISMRNKNKG
jgi:VanZ family protein